MDHAATVGESRQTDAAYGRIGQASNGEIAAAAPTFRTARMNAL
ncbi:hypothetical protein [Coriobacterium glomerans]|nr:hypothetical protein [Coriobacterium glomerans]